MNVNAPGFPTMTPFASPLGGMNGSCFLMQQQMLTMMLASMQMLLQEFLGSMGGGAMAPGFAGFGGSSAAPGVGSFLGGSPAHSGGGASHAGSSSHRPAQASSAPSTANLASGGTDFGKKLAAQAEKTARRINTPGLCLKGVNDTMEAMGLPVQREASAYMALDNFRNNKRFQEVKVSKDKLSSLPPGAVVIWNKGPGLPHGHISVALGGGREASSTVRNQLKLSTSFHVFLPK